MLWLDTETYSEIPIAHGVAKYVTGKMDVMLVAYALDDGPIKLWDRTVETTMPADLRARLDDPTEQVGMHNSSFDRTVLHHAGIATIPCERIVDTMVQAYAHGLPGQLDALCSLFKLRAEDAKMKEGRALLHLFCKPNKGARVYGEDRPAQWQTFRQYAMRDVRAMRILYGKMPKWNYPHGAERAVWGLDQKINDRGFAIDRQLAEAAVRAAAEDKTDRDAQMAQATDGAVVAGTQRDALLEHILSEYGVTLPDLQADTLQRRLDDPALPDGLKELLTLRVASSRNASAKYKTVLNAANADDRMRHGLQFCGAPTTGRWSGRMFQPQNLMRPTMSREAVDTAIQTIKSGAASLCYDNVAEVLGNCVRGVIVAPAGRMLYAADLSAIEGRALAWLAGEQDVVQFYADHDAGLVAYDSYMLAYASCFGVDPSTVTKQQRKEGKPIELAFGYGGGVAAFLTFAKVYHLDLAAMAESIHVSADRSLMLDCEGKFDWAQQNGFEAGLNKRQYSAFEYVKQRWRTARSETVRLWEALAEGFRMATLFEGKTFTAGKVTFQRNGAWLRLQLPSGRYLNFLSPKSVGKELSYLGFNRYSRKFERVPTHGGKLAGLVTQAFAGDILRDALAPIEADGFQIVLTVHDEVIAEGDPSRTVDELCAHLTRPKAWAPGLPLAAEGFKALRYRKDG